MNGEDLSDEQLMLMFRYGNRAAFGLLFEKYRSPVFNFARRMVGNAQEAEDACQEVFLRMVSAAGGYEPTARFRAWLFTIARNCCISALRRSQPLPLKTDEVAAPDAAPELEGDESNDLVEQAIRRLPDDWREMPYGEIADVTGRPLGTVKTHIHRARLRLAEMLQDHLEAK